MGPVACAVGKEGAGGGAQKVEAGGEVGAESGCDGVVAQARQQRVVRHAVRVDEDGQRAERICNAADCARHLLAAGDVALVADTGCWAAVIGGSRWAEFVDGGCCIGGALLAAAQEDCLCAMQCESACDGETDRSSAAADQGEAAMQNGGRKDGGGRRGGRGR